MQPISFHPEIAEVIVMLVDELSTEMDLHYENDELAAVIGTLVKLEEAVELLKAAGVEPPHTYTHLLARLKRSVPRH